MEHPTFVPPPRDLLLDARKWLSDPNYPNGGIYPNFLQETFDDHAAAVWIDDVYVSLWQTQGPHDRPLEKHENIKHEIFRQIKAVRESQGRPIVDPRPTEPPPLPPQPLPKPPSGHRPIDGMVALIDGGRGGVRDAHGRRLLVGVHAGDLLARFYRDRRYVEAQLDYFQAIGVHFVRVWTVLPGDWWNARTGNITPEMPGYWETVRQFARELVKRGLRWQVSQGDAARHYHGAQERRNFMRQLATTLTECGGIDRLVISVDAGNEAWQNGEPDPVKLADMLRAFVDVLPVPLSALTSASDEGTLNEYAVAPATTIAYHQSRFHFRRATERAWTAGYWDGKKRAFLLSDEPVGVNNADGIDRVGAHVSVTENPAEWRNLEAIGMTYLVQLMTPQLLSVMTSPGVISDEPFANYPCIAHTVKLASTLPQDVQSWKHFHGGDGRDFSSLRVLGVASDHTRCEHALSMATGDVVVAVYGDPKSGPHEFPAISGFEGEVVNPGTLTREPIRFSAGAKVRMQFDYGRYLIGRRL